MTQLVRSIRRRLRPLRQRWVRSRRRRALGDLAPYVEAGEKIAGWARGDEAVELARTALAMPRDAVIVEIGSFLGSSAVLLAGARKVAGSGVVHCVDPFDGSGDAHSTPYYSELTEVLDHPIRDEFDRNLEQAGVSEWVVAHSGTAEEIATAWRTPIDMLFLDGDQSPEGARSAFEAWSPFLVDGGTIALHNSADRVYSPGHDGNRRVVMESIQAPDYVDVRCIGTTTFARRAR